jgi:CheY-like chemotaxis protein
MMISFTKNKKTVLVVDDEEPIRLLVKVSLKRMAPDTDVIMVDSPLKAIEIAESKKPDLIISDLSMPDMSGIELCSVLKISPITHDIPFILLTGSSKTGDIDKAYSAGIADYILKPINYDRFSQKIGQVL